MIQTIHIQRKKQGVWLLSLAACALIACTAVFLNKSPQGETPDSFHTAIATADTGREQIPAGYISPENGLPEQKATGNKPVNEIPGSAGESKGAAVTHYLSEEKEGIIGTYAGKQLDNPADNIFTVRIDQILTDNDKVWLSYELEGVSDYTNVPKSINDRLATGGYLVKLSDKSALQREQLNVTWLSKGENRIQFSLPENAKYGYKVSKLSIEVEKGTAGTPLVVNASPAAYNNKAYLHGFIRQKDIPGARFYVDGEEAENRDGEFEAIVPVSNSRKVSVKAILANGKELTKEIVFTKGDIASIEYAMDNNIRQDSKTFRKGEAGELQLASALLKVEANALLLPSKNVTVSTLRTTDLAALDMGMDNVTAEHKGYRFLPHGEHFTQGATVTIKYDRTKIPNGFTEDDIRTYYFDLDTKHWVALKRDTIDKKNQLIVSTTTHFTDMINGVIQTPESPETQGFAPTMMNDIKAADPTAKVQLIAPPAANNRGSAGLSYGFEMPPARNGMSPSLGIQYNSDGGSGWLGEGWDLSTPGISVDTRWGVPRWDDAMETETYSMGGSMLMTMDDNGESSVAHRGDKINRKADRQFYPRNEGSFSKIIRKGNNSASYSWEVTDKSGTKYIYGGNGAVLKGSAKTLSGNKEVIVEWKLKRVEELHGDWVEYTYETVDEPVKGGLVAKAIYLKEVKAGNRGSDPHTVVTLTSAAQKDKKTNSARYGFLTSSNKLLNKVDITFEGQTLRSYEFGYKAGAFNTNILDKVTHLDSNGAVFASHTMDYYDDVKSAEGYKPFENTAETWNLHDDGLNAGFVNPVSSSLQSGDFSDKPSAFGGNKSTSAGGSLYVGVGPGANVTSKDISGGVSLNYSYSEGSGLSTFVDINGDGIPDKVFVQGGSMYYRAGSSDGQFGNPVKVSGASEFSKSYTNNYSGGAQAVVMKAVAGTDVQKTSTNVSRYFMDVNNDGLVDLVVGGSVYFNHIEKDSNGNLVPTFTLSSGDTPSPIRGGGIIDDSDTQVDPQEQADMIANNPLQDVIRVWEAPFNGTIKIEGNVQLQAPAGGYDMVEYGKADGVRVAIQVAGSEKWNKSIAKGDFASYSASVSSAAVTKGQKVYFRVQSGTSETANGNFDKVKWSPVITYTDRTNYTNPDAQGTAVYQITDADFISSETPDYIPSGSAVSVSGNFVKPVTSDNITLKAVLSNNKTLEDENQTLNPAYQEVAVYQRTFGWDETYSGDISFNVNNTISGENLQLVVSSETNVAFGSIRWTPVISYTVNGNALSAPAAVRYTVFASQAAAGQPYTLAANGNLRIEPKFSGLTGMPNTAANGMLTMSVKNVTGLIAKQPVTITNGIVAAGSIINSVAAEAGTIWVEYYVTDAALASVLGDPSAVITVNAASTTVAANMFTTRDNEGYGNLYRGWGQFVYNANDGRYGNPVTESLLKLPQSEDEANAGPVIFTPMYPDVTNKSFWLGNDSQVYIDNDIMSASRLGQKDVILENPLSGLGSAGANAGNCIQGSGAPGVSQKTRSTSTSVMAGSMVSGVRGTLSTAKGKDETVLTFADLNGDGYPDIISKNEAQLTNTRGGYDGEVLRYNGYHSSESSSKAIGAGGNPVHASSISSKSANLKASKAKAGSALSNGAKSIKDEGAQKAAYDALQKVMADEYALKKAQNQAYVVPGGNLSDNGDKAVETFMDVNGDGLPDKILSNKQVMLNLGYGFTEAADWGLDNVQEGSNTDVSLSLGFNKDASSWSGGIGVNATTSQSEFTMSDINGDGLLDKVRISSGKVYVAFNLGNAFTSETEWKGLSTTNKSTSVGESVNAAFTTGFPIPLLGIRVVVNPGVNTGHSISRTTADIRDVDGDGFPDIVSSDRESEMTVYRSTIARTNKLKSVNNPLGGGFTLDYARSEATYGHPGGKWVMASVEVNDGIHDDGANMKTVFEYADGKQERHEREFLGFGKVITKNIDTEASEENKVYRKAIQQYDVNSVYTAGNQLSAVVEDASGNRYTESLNEYYSYKLTPSADTYSFAADDNICTDRAIAFTPVKYTKSVVYEGQADGMTANESYYEYYLNGSYGDLKSYKYSDKGTLGNNGTGAYNYMTAVQYTHNTAKHIFGLPVKVQVKGSDGKLYRQTEAAYDINYANHLTKVTQTLDESGNKAVIDIEYDKYGNITKKTLPANYKGQRMWYKYLYDRDYNMYVERVEDAFGYRSEMENYDYRYGMPLLSRDMNGYTLETTIDHLGRVETITGPNEQALGLPYTIKFEYSPLTPVGGNTSPAGRPGGAPAYAVTKHYDPQNPNDDLETVTFVDGFGRAVQVKKDGVITETTNGTNPVDRKVMIVSGRAKFDPFGRVREAFYPVSEAMGSKTVFNPAFDNITPTRTEYDVMDRAVKTILPDNSESLMEYGLQLSPVGGAGSGLLVTTVTDAMGGKQSTFTNGSGLTVKTEQYSGPDGTITTRFEFDPINQLLKAIDNGNNETLSAYDMAGRRTQVTHPASGTTAFKYDNVSNLLSKQTANLEEEDKYITYDYDYSRLTAITYPDHPENNVRYTYGNKNASNNRVGRLMLQEDGSGAQEFFYGRLGEMTKVRRTLIIPNQAIATYVTQWKYDSWNRLEEMIYPDEEKITYSYNTAGLLESVKGEKAYSYNYVNKLGYDKFEQRIYMKYCNGAETNYTYDPQRRRLENLSVTAPSGSPAGGGLILDNRYSYDKVDNVLSVINSAPLPPPTGTGGLTMGGQMSHTYNYDGLYRLTSANGTYTGVSNTPSGGRGASYTLEMAYDNLHNITGKKQHIEQKGIQFDGVLKAGYELAYNYVDNPFQISTLNDDNYRTEGTDAKDLTKKEHKYEYDANGNLVYINTERPKKDGTQTPKSTERKLLWDEENRLEAIDDNGFVSNYWYDAAGERTVKTSGESQQMYVNSVFSGGDTQTANFTAYVNAYLVVSKGGQYTKHIYIGSQRIVSKLGDLDSYGPDPRRIEYAGSNVDGAKVDYKTKYTALQQTIKDRYAAFEVPYYGKDNDDYVNGQGFCCDDNVKNTLKFGVGNDNAELYQYYYHSDHLGSSSLITNLDGEVVQHIEYVPFGEVFIEERNNTWNTPYLFNAKELDEETGLYYYGARYYDPRTSVWLSTDPLQEKYPNISTYAYAALNPIKFIDPNGKDPIIVIWASMSKDKSPTGKTEVGHAGIFIENYEIEISSDGTESYRSLGTYSYYDLWPADRSNMTDPTSSVDAKYMQKELSVKGQSLSRKMIDEYIKNNDVTSLEGRPADGAIRLLMSPKKELALKLKLEIMSAAGEQYNPRDNNCTTYVSEALNAVGLSLQPESITTVIASIYKGYPLNNKSHTPNNLFKQLKKQTLFQPSVIKDPGNRISQNYSDAVVDDNVKQAIKE